VLPLNAAVSRVLARKKNEPGSEAARAMVEIVWSESHSQVAGLRSAIHDKFDRAGRRSARVPLLHLPSMLGGLTVDLLKVDCEGCEFELLGHDPRWFTNRSIVRLVGAEIHVHAGLVNRSKEAHFALANRQVARKTQQALDRRGCTWRTSGIVQCR